MKDFTKQPKRLRVVLLLVCIAALLCCAPLLARPVSVLAPAVPKGKAAPPQFSQPGGFYDEPFYLELLVPEGTTVHYTLDCSAPTAASAVYEGPIYVYNRTEEPNIGLAVPNVTYNYTENFVAPPNADKAFVVRAAAVNSRGQISEIKTQTYFVGLDAYADRYVLSLVTDPDNLFGSKGIYVTGPQYDCWLRSPLRGVPDALDGTLVGRLLAYIASKSEPEVNFMRKGKQWEREANLELLSGEDTVLNQAVGIRISGNSSRFLQLKRFSIFARKGIGGSDWFPVPLWGEDREHAIITRNGNLNRISQELGQTRDVLTMPTARAAIFLNGEYWCGEDDSWCIYEKFCEENIAANLGLNARNIAIVKNGTADNRSGSGSNPYSNIHTYLTRHDLSDPKSYAEYNQIIDIQSYIDATCIQLFLADVDYQEEWNSFLWHTVKAENDAEGDTRWRWGLYDMDLAWYQLDEQFGDIPTYEINPFTMYGVWQETPITQWPIFSALRQNPQFLQDLVLTFMDQLNTNLSEESLAAILARETLAPEERAFFENRRPYILRYFAEEFNLEQPDTLTIRINTPEAGRIQLNTISPDLSTGEWTGEYFLEYPVTLTAQAENGFRFVGWQTDDGLVSEETISLPLHRGGTEVTAVFTKSGSS